MPFECEAEVVPTGPIGELVAASPASSFGFIITIGRESLSCAVRPGSLRAGVSNRVRLSFLVPAAAQAVVRVGSSFDYLDCGKRGTGRVLEVAHA